MSKAAKPKLVRPVKTKPITLEEVAKIQSRFAKAHDGKVPKGGLVARLQRAAQRNTDHANEN